MKKLIDDPESYLLQGLRGFGRAHADLVRVDLDRRIVVRSEPPRAGKVTLVSGGGSGHEPLHGGFVGYGMLNAACPGEVFTSPTPDPIVAATQAVNAGAGVVHIVKNYTGDVMNFQIAAELAADEGIPVETVLVDDDVAVEDSLYTAGRRGTGATVLVEKIAGACAEAGGALSDVVTLGRRVVTQSRSFGVALTSCTTPAAGRPTFEIGPDEMEFGVGIHGEPGRRREKIRPASEIVREMADAILTELNPAGPRVLAFVNGLGGTPLGELYLVYDELARVLDGRGIEIARSLVGSYVTSLDMAGASITLLALDDDLLGWWDAPVQTPAPPVGPLMADTIDASAVRRWIAEAARVLGEQRQRLTDLDAAIGDADHGVNMDRGFRAAVTRVDALAATASPGEIVRTVGVAVMSSVGGASGPLWGMAFRRAGQQLGDAPEIDGSALVGALDQIVQAMRGLGKANVGDKTMLDALAPAAEALRTRIEAGAALPEALTAAREAAEAGAQATIPLQARKGRASYLGERSIGHQDPGATSAALILGALETVVADAPA